VKAFVYVDGTLERNPLCSLQPIEQTKERSDVVEPRRRKDEPIAAEFVTEHTERALILFIQTLALYKFN